MAIYKIGDLPADAGLDESFRQTAEIINTTRQREGCRTGVAQTQIAELEAFINQAIDTMPPGIVSPWAYGRNAHYRSETISANRFPAGTPEHERWREGWMSGMRDISRRKLQSAALLTERLDE